MEKLVQEQRELSYSNTIQIPHINKQDQRSCQIEDTKDDLLKTEETKFTDDYLSHFNRLIIHLDMDAYYAQVEMKKHNIDLDVRLILSEFKLQKPVGVVQWFSLIALNYVAK